MKIKVLHILNTGDYSGAENVVITMINAYKDSVDATYMSIAGAIEERLKEEGIAYYPTDKLTVQSIRKAVRELQPDIIHAHDYTAGILSSLLMTKIPVINHLHANPPWMKSYGKYSFVYAASCIRFKKIMTVSESIMKQYVFGRIYQKKTTVVGNPTNPERIRALAGSFEGKQYDIAFLGRLSAEKGASQFVDIISKLKINRKNISAVMIGEGQLRKEIETKIQETDLEQNITLAGFQKNPYPLLKQARIMLMPSVWEGYGLAAVEALALGVPVIASDAGGLPTIVNDDCGKICRGIDEYTEIVSSLLIDEKELQRLSENAAKRADEIANLKEYTDRVIVIYHKVLKRKTE